MRELEEVGLIELVDEKKRRGAVEHFYRAIARPLLSAEEWEQLSLDDRQGFSAWIIQLLLVDASQALAAGTFDARGDRHLSRTPLLVDEEGWRELVEIQANALRAMLEVQAASAAGSNAADGEEGIPTVAAMTLFEMPPKRRSRRGRRPSRGGGRRRFSGPALRRSAGRRGRSGNRRWRRRRC